MSQSDDDNDNDDVDAASRPRLRLREPLIQADSELRPGQRQFGKTSRGNQSTYHHLLNSVITDAVVDTHAQSDLYGLFDSQVGASFWTSREKDNLFHQLGRTGLSNLPALHAAVRTKSESEIQVYLRLLRHESIKQPLPPGSDGVELVGVPAALEISEACGLALEDAAISLANRVDEHDVILQKAEFGDNWLVDEEAAYYIDLAFDQRDDSACIKDEAQEEEYATNKIETRDQAQGSQRAEAAVAEVDTEERLPQPNSAFISQFVSTVSDSDASITLLRPSVFLQLSRSLFMNSSTDSSSNYQLAADLLPGPCESPAIFRGAFEDFYNLTVNLTRRLVRATLFQAMSRLRAWDSTTGRGSWTPLAAVREVDVRTTLDLLGLQENSKAFWAKVARRNGVQVYSESQKYRNGRAGTKNGVRLTYEEVEAELGLERVPIAQTFRGAEGDDGNDHDQPEPESEDFTEAESESGDGDAQDAQLKRESEQELSRPRKRQRAMSPSSYLRAERRYLDAIDHNASVDEETHLWKLLREKPPENAFLKHCTVPDRPEHLDSRGDDWEAKMEYEAEWENAFGWATREEFHEMNERGLQRRVKKGDLGKATANANTDHPIDDEDGQDVNSRIEEQLGADSAGESHSGLGAGDEEMLDADTEEESKVQVTDD